MTEKPTSQVLFDAAAIIHEFGWAQGGFGNEEVGYCMLGGILASCGMPKNDRHTWASELNSTEQKSIDQLIKWNDKEERTKQEVTNLLYEMGIKMLDIEEAQGE